MSLALAIRLWRNCVNLLQWTKKLPIQSIHLAFLMVLVSLTIQSFNWLGLGILLMAVTCLFRYYPIRQAGKALLVLLVFGSGIFVYRSYQNFRYQSEPDQLTEIKPILDTISVNGDQLSFRGRSNGRTYQVFYVLKSEEEQTYFKSLDEPVKFHVSVSLSEAEEMRNFKGFNYRNYLKTQGIYRLATIDKLQAVEKSSAIRPAEVLQTLRRKLIVYIDQHFPSPMKHYMTGLLLGYLGKDFEEMSDLYTSLGIIHLFALSGMQVGFFLLTFRKFCLKLGLTLEQVDALQVPFSYLYAGLTGFSISVIRSLIQAFLSRLGIKGLDNFAWALMLILVFLPRGILTTGAVLSLSYAFVLSVFDWSDVSGWWGTVLQSLAISLGMLPLLMWYFSVYQPLSLLLTATLSVLFDMAMLPGLSLILLVSPIAKLTVFNPLFSWLEQGISLVAKLSGPSWIFGSPSLVMLVLLVLSLAVFHDYFKKKNVRLIVVCLLALLFFLVKNPLENEVTVVDIGQGDSIFLRDMWGKTILIDVGGKVSFESQEAWQKHQTAANAERTLIPYLKSRGVGKIDQLVLTHTDTDHMGDMEVVAQNFKIGEILVSPGSLTNQEFVTRLKAMKVKVRVIQAGERLAIMGSQLQVLYPWETGDGGNNDSIILYGHLLNKNFLFTGDLEDGELELIKRYPKLPVDILKAGHHGSKGSSYPEFLAHIGADTALVSAGKNNRYGHPNPETLERFEAEQMTVYRTDQQGAIRFHGWQSWKVETVR
ncbi:DNA internalization-related competence protein ComEC/Rec2 [Streptococcus caprae]|uniref:DNA internalization-related competence protein ComEC/Rec2 n=1 Tax=Streptococcus caprae TaxID=1640501 RepID=A0ABV8CYH7_9STRE